MTLTVTWPQVLAWRMGRHMLDPIAQPSVPDVVRRLCGVQAQVASTAELAVRVRRQHSQKGEVARSLADGRLVKTWAMRGALHLLTPEEGGAFLSLFAHARPWERPSWQRYFGLTSKLLEELRLAVREALKDEALTREELVASVTGRSRLRPLAEGLRSGWGTLLKPLAWQGELCFGPSRGGRPTFMRPEQASLRWAGLPDLDEAAPTAVAAYLAAHGPATTDAFGRWLSGGWFGRRQLRSWFADLGDRLVEVEVDGEPAHILAEHVDELTGSRESKSLRLMPGFDQFVLGAGTGDGHVVPAARRAAVSRQAGWISPVVIVGGVVCGTWEADGPTLRVAWFSEAGRPPRRALGSEAERLAEILGQSLTVKLVTT
jgi:hypothetical protein